MSKKFANRFQVVFAAVGAAMVSSAAYAQVDTVYNFLNKANTLGSDSASQTLAGFSYDSASDTMYITAFTAGGGFRKVTGVTTATPSGAYVISEPQLQTYYRDGDPNNSVITPTAFAIELNPAQVTTPQGTFAAGTVAYVLDAEQTKTSNVINNAASKRFYRYSLGTSSGLSASDVLTTVMTRKDYINATSPSTANTSTLTEALGRQFAYATDKVTDPANPVTKSIYFVDSLNNYGGLYRLKLSDNSVTRVVTENGSNRFTGEPTAVTLASGVDRIYANGTTATGNVNGLNQIDVPATGSPTVTQLVQASTLSNFLNTTSTVTVDSTTTDDAGNVYFEVSGGTGTARRGALLRLDSAGRLAKVTTYGERYAFYTENFPTASKPVITMTRFQTNTISVTGNAGAFSVPRILYVESAPGAIGAVNAYATGDFDKNGVVDQSDIALFTTSGVLQTRNTTTTTSSKFKFDLNGDSAAPSSSVAPTAVVDYADVKILQQFYPFRNGDANINQSVDTQDFNTLALNYNTTGKVWTDGDFNGDNVVNLLDFNVLATNYGLAVPVLPGATPGAAVATTANLGTLVPEPASAAVLGMAFGMLVSGRRRKN